jgi:hypothetical protein
MCFKKIKSWFKKKSSAHTPIPHHSINIEEFVKASIVGIMSGIRGAQKEYQKDNTAYAPLISPSSAPPLIDIGGGTKGYADKIYDLEFDLAVTIDESSSSKFTGASGIKVAGLYTGDLGISGESTGGHSTVSRIRFKIPVRYPLAKLNKPDWNAES